MAGTAYLFIRKNQRVNEYELKFFSKMFVLILKKYLWFKNYVGAGAWGWPREMLWGGRWEGGSCLGTHVRIKDFKIKKRKRLIELTTKKGKYCCIKMVPH